MDRFQIPVEGPSDHRKKMDETIADLLSDIGSNMKSLLSGSVCWNDEEREYVLREIPGSGVILMSEFDAPPWSYDVVLLGFSEEDPVYVELAKKLGQLSRYPHSYLESA